MDADAVDADAVAGWNYYLDGIIIRLSLSQSGRYYLLQPGSNRHKKYIHAVKHSEN